MLIIKKCSAYAVAQKESGGKAIDVKGSTQDVAQLMIGCALALKDKGFSMDATIDCANAELKKHRMEFQRR